MEAAARRVDPTSYTHELTIRQHRLLADEPAEHGGDDQGASPQELLAASLASCTAITIEMYSKRKGWELGEVEVRCEYDAPERGQPTMFRLGLRIPEGCTAEQAERLQVIAAKCPVHRTLEGEVVFEQNLHFGASPTG